MTNHQSHNEQCIAKIVRHNGAPAVNFIRPFLFTLKPLYEHTLFAYDGSIELEPRRRDHWLAYVQSQLDRVFRNRNLQTSSPRYGELRIQQDVGAMQNKNKEPDTEVQDVMMMLLLLQRIQTNRLVYRTLCYLPICLLERRIHRILACCLLLQLISLLLLLRCFQHSQM